MSVNNPNPIDIAVGAKIREQRIMRGMSQEKLSKALGLTYQQVQKYERGANRIGASKLWKIAKTLQINVGDLFENVEQEEGAAPVQEPRRIHLELCRAFDDLGPRTQKALYLAVRAAAEDAREHRSPTKVVRADRIAAE